MPGGRSFCFLLVDDDEEDIELLSFGLKEQEPQIEILYFTEAYKALDYLSETPEKELPSIVLVDYQMPKLIGLDFIRKLRELNHCQQLPAVLYSTTVKQVSDDMKKTLNFHAMSKGNDLADLMRNAEEMIRIAKKAHDPS